jgi:hypothetical protein
MAALGRLKACGEQTVLESVRRVNAQRLLAIRAA